MPGSDKQTKQPVIPEAIARRVMDLITDRDLSPGDRLTEAFVATRFGVGRTAAREALRILAAKQIIETEPNKGARIVRLTPHEAREVMDIRGGLLRVGVKRFARDASESQKHDLAEKALALAADADGLTTKKFMQRQREINSAILTGTGSRRLTELVVNYHPGLPRFLAPLHVRSAEAKARAAESWRRFGEAVLDGDWERASSEYERMHDQGVEDALAIYEQL